MITLLQLDYFRKLSATEHITQTARDLKISQTALSYMIIKLEKELGVKLFDRSKRKIQLNDAGRIYLEYVNSIFASLENGFSAVQKFNASRESIVHLGAGTSSVWSALFHDFCVSYPQHTLQQSNHTIPYLEKALTDMTMNIVLAGEEDLHVSDIEKIWFKTDHIYVCVSSTHPLANRESVYMEELVDESFIGLNKTVPWTTYCDRLFERAGYAPKVVLECDYTLRAALVESNFGIALTSESARDVNLLKPNRYIRVADEYAIRKMCLYYNPHQHLTQATRDFLDFCVSYYKDEQ